MAGGMAGGGGGMAGDRAGLAALFGAATGCRSSGMAMAPSSGAGEEFCACSVDRVCGGCAPLELDCQGGTGQSSEPKQRQGGRLSGVTKQRAGQQPTLMTHIPLTVHGSSANCKQALKSVARRGSQGGTLRRSMPTRRNSTTAPLGGRTASTCVSWVGSVSTNVAEHYQSTVRPQACPPARLSTSIPQKTREHERSLSRPQRGAGGQLL